jgi:hypothetical protein
VSYYRRDHSEVRCDLCGFCTYYRPALPGDPAAAMVEDSPFTCDPTEDWCWTPLYSAEFHPCSVCGGNANTPFTIDQAIDTEIRRLAIFGIDLTVAPV